MVKWFAIVFAVVFSVGVLRAETEAEIQARTALALAEAELNLAKSKQKNLNKSVKKFSYRNDYDACLSESLKSGKLLIVWVGNTNDDFSFASKDCIHARFQVYSGMKKGVAVLVPITKTTAVAYKFPDSSLLTLEKLDELKKKIYSNDFSVFGPNDPMILSNRNRLLPSLRGGC